MNAKMQIQNIYAKQQKLDMLYFFTKQNIHSSKPLFGMKKITTYW